MDRPAPSERGGAHTLARGWHGIVACKWKGKEDDMRNRFTPVLVVVIVLGLSIGAAFAAGSVYGRDMAAKNIQPVIVGVGSTSGSGIAAASGTADAAGAVVAGTGRQGFGGGGFGGAISGTVNSVHDQQLTLALANGQELTVALTADTHIGTVSQASQNVLSSGTTVLVTGTRGSNGTVTASAVIVVPSGFLPTPAAGASATGGPDTGTREGRNGSPETPGTSGQP
jgi:hypothetical protein